MFSNKYLKKIVRTSLLLIILCLINPLSLFALAPMHSASPDHIYIAESASHKQACDALSILDSSQNCDSGGSGVTNIVNAVVNILSFVVGIVAIIFVLISGFRFITSNGDPNRVGSAKNTLIYAIVGIVIAVLAQVIVHFVLFKAKSAV